MVEVIFGVGDTGNLVIWLGESTRITIRLMPGDVMVDQRVLSLCMSTNKVVVLVKMMRWIESVLKCIPRSSQTSKAVVNVEIV